ASPATSITSCTMRSIWLAVTAGGVTLTTSAADDGSGEGDALASGKNSLEQPVSARAPTSTTGTAIIGREARRPPLAGSTAVPGLPPRAGRRLGLYLGWRGSFGCLRRGPRELRTW